jgi:hypothetical protein
MGKGLALLVGLKSVDPVAYNGWDGTGGCWGCELDVDNMARILEPLGYQTKTLKTAAATRDGILSSLYRLAENTVGGDVAVFYYSGHGGQQPDLDNEELDGKDETLVAYDREVIDDKIHEALKRFKKGVQVIMISDSCNSGTNYRGVKTVRVNERATFRPIAQKSKKDVPMGAELIHMGGCRDGFGSSGYQMGGAFTMALCDVWRDGAFSGTLKDLHAAICQTISSSQKPQYTEYETVTDEFRNRRAFALTEEPAANGVQELPVFDEAPTKAEIREAGQKHQYRFKVSKIGDFVIETSGRTDVTMKLYGPNSDTKLIAEDDDSGPGLNAKIAERLKAGTYYVTVQHYSTTGTGPYGIKVIRQ